MKKRILCLFLICVFGTTAQAAYVIPIGEAVGVCIMSDGLLVVDTLEVTGSNGEKIAAAENAGIKKGDRILSADGNRLKTAEQLADYTKERANDIVLTIQRGSESINIVITPIKTEEGYRLGLLVKDSLAGIGTITFINPEDGSFAALGHGISDSDTEMLMVASGGSLIECDVTEPVKGVPGTPGELNGNFGSKSLGRVLKNTESGVYGKAAAEDFSGECAETACAEEIQIGKAYILAEVDSQGVKEYEIEIKKINKSNNEGKNIVFTVCDEALIEKTGGVVQGMSGSPIIQNGKIIGAVTHVLVNDPTRGYGIFIENMLVEGEKIK